MEEGLGQRVQHLEQVMVSRVSFHQNASVQFATVLVANLMIINSGALFAFSSMLDKMGVTTTDRSAYCAATSFVFGIVLATVCGYAAYHNFMALAHYESLEGRVRVFYEKYPDAKPGSPELDNQRRDVQSNQQHYLRLVRLTLWLGNISGILSLGAFIAGCYFAGSLAFP